MEQFRRGELIFDVNDSGRPDDPVVVLLHGFPQLNTTWDGIISLLSARGYRCLAPNQRGYSAGARPKRRRDYIDSELVADVYALIEASGTQRVHLVGHDWGGLVGWAFAAQHPDRIASFSSLSSPHPAALRHAMLTSRQGLASWYAYGFQLPSVPERLFSGSARNAARLSKMLQRGGQSRTVAERDAGAMADSELFTAAVNWYRAALLSSRIGNVTVPTLFVWSQGDKYLLRKAVNNTGRYVSADYRLEILDGSHWLPDQQPDTVANLLLDWFAAHPPT
jgi:pimeloyl-ACP methyl ester carboxylesterase